MYYAVTRYATAAGLGAADQLAAQSRAGSSNRYIAAVEAGESPDPPVFFRPGDDESLDAFVERQYQPSVRRSEEVSTVRG